jgi:hypothetical protein
VQRVDDRAGKAAGSARILRGDFAGDPERGHRRSRGEPGVRLDGKRGADECRTGTAHRGDDTHQRIAVGDHRAAHAVGHAVDAAGQRDDGRMRLGKARCGVARRVTAGERAELRGVEPHHRGRAAEQFARKLGARRRADR